MNALEKIQAAAKAGQLLPDAVENLQAWLKADLPAWAQASIEELVERGAWFYRYLEFGTGGMRGRTIGLILTPAEQEGITPAGTPGHPAAGSNMLNDITLVRATIGLFRYTRKYLDIASRFDLPKLVIAHDVRHFSRHFCELAASTWSRLGGVAIIFDGPRSTPQLSFSVRHLKAHAGIVITASHNPPHDNGYKAYFEDGGQVVPPHDKGIVSEVNAVALDGIGPFLEKDLSRVITLSRVADDAYLAVASKAAIDTEVFKRTKLKVAFTNIHGTGGIASVPLLLHAGVDVHEVPEQTAFDPRFPTVNSPNPENAEALSRAIALAEAKGLDVVLATDPDCDRMGCAVRNKAGKMELLTGNQIGALLAEYRIGKYKEIGWLPREGTATAALIKTFVTSPLQDAIANGHGVKVINTLTGFKWIAAKIRGYEEKMKAAFFREQGVFIDYDATSFDVRARLLQKYSTFYIFGGEESYGYLPNDYVRDKDGNAACLMFAELCAFAKSRGQAVTEYLDSIYLRYGFFLEGVINIYYEGASGAAKIKRILDSYRATPPTAFGDIAVARFSDFGREVIADADGERIPSQDLYFVTLANGYSFAARGSGTEPKMKFYLFAQSAVNDPRQLDEVKKVTKQNLDAIKGLIEADAKRRAEG
jgi:phosphoglucomutase